MAKRKRNRLLIQFKEDNPDLTLKEIGEAFGITKQAVSQLKN